MTNEAKQLLKDKPELCKEIAKYFNIECMATQFTPYDDTWDAFFKEHTDKPDWEILSRRFTEDGNEIDSVHRLSDNEVFTVGDETNEGKVKRFFIHNNEMLVDCVGRNGWGPYTLNELAKRTPLFTTEDGKAIFTCDDYFIVSLSNYGIIHTTASGMNDYEGDVIRFSTRSAAEQWVEDNKPKYSKAQILNAGISIETIELWNKS